MLLAKQISLLFLGIATMFIFSCATVPPQQYNFQSTRVIDKKFNEVWEAIIASFAETNTPIKTIEKDSGIIVSEDLRVSFNFDGINYYSEFCDCGKPGGLNMYKQMLGSYNIFARKIADEQTAVQINTTFKASVWQGKNFLDWISCSSKGLFEATLLGKIESNLKIKTGKIGVEVERDGFIKSISKGSPAEEAGLLIGDKIISVNGKEVKSIGELLSLLKEATDAKITITILRNEKKIDYIVTKRVLGDSK